MHHRVVWHVDGLDCASSNRRLRGCKRTDEVAQVLVRAREFTSECTSDALQIDSFDARGLRRSLIVSGSLVAGSDPPTRKCDYTHGTRLTLRIDLADCREPTGRRIAHVDEYG
jgi:hypothetical protein